VGSEDNWAAVDCGSGHTVALKTNGEIWAWGLNTNGQLGDGTTTQRTSPVRVGTASNWAAVSAGEYHTVAIKNYGAIFTWGYNNYGQLGQGDAVQRTAPAKVGSDEDWVMVDASEGWNGTNGAHNLAVKSNGQLWGWGNNAGGRIGNGSTANVQSPVRVGTDSDWKAAFCGNAHSMAIKANGELWTWGLDPDGDGVMGQGTYNTNNPRPGKAQGGNYAAAQGLIYAMCTLRTDGTIWSAGYLGNGVFAMGSNSTASTADMTQGAAASASGFRIPEYF
jgi:alpha-tubulin suppressor-like RCC1 family protein